MRKLRLEIEDLKVESFDAGAAEARKGTVRGRISIHCDPSSPDTCDGGQTCDGGLSCAGGCGASGVNTCGYSCGGTCDYTCDTCTLCYRTCDC
jgi:hypothetical protein